MYRIIAFLLLLCTSAAAQVPTLPQTLPPNTVMGRLGIGPGPAQAIPFNVLFTQAGSIIELLNPVNPLSPVNLRSPIPMNGFYVSGGGAIFDVTAEAGDMPRAALYLKYTAIQNSTIPEYGSVFDCNLNSGLGGGGTGLMDNKVCMYTNAMTGPNSGGASWASATNMIIGAGDTGTFKITGEFDITNNSTDCAVGSKNCYGIYVSGDVVNPVTAMVALALPAGTTLTAAHYGILINGQHIADKADIEDSGGAQIGLCIGCLLASTHSVASIHDLSTSPAGLWLQGTYANDAILVSTAGNPPVFSVNPNGQVGSTANTTPASGLLALAMSSVNNFGLFFSNGTPTAPANDGSINLDTTGKLWLHTGGAWVQVTVP